jgi:uncharacterized protein YjbI with pentapeptide repeats
MPVQHGSKLVEQKQVYHQQGVQPHMSALSNANLKMSTLSSANLRLSALSSANLKMTQFNVGKLAHYHSLCTL